MAQVNITNNWVDPVTISFRYKQTEGNGKCSKKTCIIERGNTSNTAYTDRAFTISKIALGAIKTTIIEASLEPGNYDVGAFGLWDDKKSFYGGWL